MPRSTSPSCNARSCTPNDFTDLDQIRDRLAAFEARYNAVAKPFNWSFTRNDLDDLLARLDAHESTPKTTHWPPDNPGRTHDRDH